MFKFLGTILGFLFILALYAVITALPIMLLWNYCLIPAIPGIKSITFLQAFGLKILFSLLIHVSNNKIEKEK
mgnify:CR=1 FL=1|jgi:hypothetical protein